MNQKVYSSFKKIIFTVLAGMVFHSAAFSQSAITFTANGGNPGGLNTDGDAVTTGWTAITTGSQAANVWSANQTIPFAFTFWGTPVTQYKVSQNGVLTFDITSVIMPGTNVNIPSSTLPNLSVAGMWDDFTNTPPTGSNDVVYSKTFGVAPNRQHWVLWFSFEYGNPSMSFAYMAIVLEETTNRIYVVDEYSTTSPLGSTTVGVQLNGTTGVEWTGPAPVGAPNTPHAGNGTSVADNDYWTIPPICTGTPNAGTTAANDTTIEPCQTLNLSLVGSTASGLGITYQWESSPDNITWSPIAGATNNTYSTSSFSANTYFRCIMACSGSPDTSLPLQVLSIPSSANPVAVSSVPTVCPGAPFLLSLTGIGAGTYGYQWQSSADNTTWTDIFGANFSTYNLQEYDTTWYRCIITCGANTDTSAFVYVPLTAFFSCYCNNSFATSTIDEDIDTVRIGSFVNISTPPTCGTYTNFQSTSNFPVVMLGQTYPIGVGTRDCEGTFFYNRYVKVYIDYDHDGIYNDPLELVLSGPAAALNQSNVIGSFTVPPTALTGFTGMRVVCNETTIASNVQPCGTYTWGETEDYLVWVNAVPVNDAGAVTLVSPGQPTCSLSDTVIVDITNIGTDTLYTADINLSINGGPTTTYNWSGVLDSGQTATVNIGTFTINDADQLKIWTSDPNGAGDDFIWNDTLVQNVYNALAGVYTVYGATPDYNTLTDAVNDLVIRGACADVTFNVRSGQYNEQVSIPVYPMVNNGNYRVTIQSEVLDASQVEFSYTPGSTTDNYVVQFNGGDNVTLNELTLKNASIFGRVVEFKGNADNNHIRNSVIIGDSTVTSDDFNRILIVSTADNDDGTQIVNNELRGGSRAISLSGVSVANPETGLVIDSNVFRSFYFVGIGAFNAAGPQMNRNDFWTTSANTNVFRMYAQGINNGIQVVGNRFRGDQGGFGINLDNVSGNPNNIGLVANNFVYMGSTATGNSEGIYLQNGTTFIDVVNNSVHVKNTNINSGAVVIGAGTPGGASNINLYNNNAVNSGSGLSLIVTSSFNLGASDLNNWYATGTNVVRYNSTNYTTVGAYSTATGFDAGSVSVDPNFTGDDLHTCRVELDNVAMVYAGISNDFDNDTRNVNTPDIGADEFITAQNFSLGNDTIKCPGDSVFIGAENLSSANYYWSPTLETSAGIYATAPGLYIVQIVTGCGTALDSIVVTDLPLPTASWSYTNTLYTVVTTNTSTNGVSYFWDFGDGNTSTEFEPIHAYSTNGDYTVTLTVVSECGDTATFTQTIEVNPQFQGTEEIGISDLNVYPNPSDGNFTISFTTDNTEDVRVVVMDLSGREVFAGIYGNTNGQFIQPMNIQNLSAGTYLLQLQSGKYTHTSRIIIK